MRWQASEESAAIPMKVVGPVRIKGSEVDGELPLPLATYETPLWPSTHRGAIACNRAGGINAVVLDDRMTRSVLLEAPDIFEAQRVINALSGNRAALEAVVGETSRFARLLDLHTQVVGTLIYLRFAFHTGDASGHNMATLAAERLMDWLISEYPRLEYVSVSGNYCSDKKNSAVNGILGRGKYVVADVLLPASTVRRVLKAEPERIVQLNIKKNLIGSILSGGVRTANAHFANMLLGFYLATGQDAANIIEGSQGVVHAELRGADLYFSVTLPNLIVGSVGNGKSLDFVQRNLGLLGCLDREAPPGANARRLAVAAAAAVLCGELSLLAAQSVPGELMQSHVNLERRDSTKDEVDR
ncbi:hydroxymethylglutaryl-CoA reductase [Halotalea alkalilenta]|uniref:Hydroxymethylglutaryl-CoA reductase n=1 Tax=Halotalea alkalilenta TaxID=376489 RepID=A0A172YIR1_9GAMM|nr:hydroxymethylglutaryl-CoA reductase [Halotalea alkalilenta]ANF59097.1 hydroxymethylglutaryl-CoA reductase [Halotalea alkalilenta]